jgi:hypothetical protein
LPKLKWKKWASAKMAEQHNKQEDIRDVNNHCYDALKYAMTFMDDLTPDKMAGREVDERFHSLFQERFSPVTPISDTDDSDSWGSWKNFGTTQNLEG